MELLHLSTSLAQFEDAVAFVNDQPSPVLLSVADANTVVAVAALKDQWRTALGIWIDVDEGYVASMCARDVKSLSWLIELDHVVVSARNARAQAHVVSAMLTNDEVNLVNEVATIHGAFNRPAPPHPVRVWSFEGATLESNGEELHATSSSSLVFGNVTTYS